MAKNVKAGTEAKEEHKLLTVEQRLAMVFLLRYYMNRNRTGFAEVAKVAKIPPAFVGSGDKIRKEYGRHVQTFHDQFNGQHVEKIWGFLNSEYSNSSLFEDAPALIKNLVDQMRGVPRQNAIVDHIFADVIEDGEEWKTRVARVYAGTWYIVRYAAHLGPGLQTPQKNEDGKANHSMVYALMNIERQNYRLGNDLPAFEILYHPRQDHSDEPPRSIRGNIISFKEGPYMQLLGLEAGAKHPVVIGANQNKDINSQPKSFRGFIMRKVEFGSFVGGFVVFIRSQKKWDELLLHETLSKVGVLTRTDLIERLECEVPQIRSLIEDLRNVADHDGYCMLHLK